MARYAAFLASINVGGNRIAMADLKAALEAEGFAGVETVVASGNVLFSVPDAPDAALGERIARIVEQRLGIRTFAAVRTAEDVRAAVEDNPFTGIGADNLVHTLFLERAVNAAAFAQLLADHAGRGPEKLAIGDRCLYIDFVDGVAGSKLTGAFMEKRLGCRGTARNVRSLARIHARMR